MAEKERLKSKGFALLHPLENIVVRALDGSHLGLLIFSLVALPLSAPGGGRAPSPRRPSLEFKSFSKNKRTPSGTFHKAEGVRTICSYSFSHASCPARYSVLHLLGVLSGGNKPSSGRKVAAGG